MPGYTQKHAGTHPKTRRNAQEHTQAHTGTHAGTHRNTRAHARTHPGTPHAGDSYTLRHRNVYITRKTIRRTNTFVAVSMDVPTIKDTGPIMTGMPWLTSDMWIVRINPKMTKKMKRTIAAVPFRLILS